MIYLHDLSHAMLTSREVRPHLDGERVSPVEVLVSVALPDGSRVEVPVLGFRIREGERVPDGGEKNRLKSPGAVVLYCRLDEWPNRSDVEPDSETTAAGPATPEEAPPPFDGTYPQERGVLKLPEKVKEGGRG